jgi:ribosome modulation factor
VSKTQDAFAEGYDAYLAKGCDADNPYHLDAENHALWLDGWRAAQAAENPDW